MKMEEKLFTGKNGVLSYSLFFSRLDFQLYTPNVRMRIR